jgi:hypothetical protein
MTEEDFSKLAMSFPGTEAVKHFNRTGFKVIGKRMFATYLAADNTANIFLTPAEQKVFCSIDRKNIYPVPNKWGEKGATTFRLITISREILHEAILSAYKDALGTKGAG